MISKANRRIACFSLLLKMTQDGARMSEESIEVIMTSVAKAVLC